MLDMGARIVAVELGANLAARLRRRFAGRPLDVVEADFDETMVPAAEFDLAVAAMSLHWLDLSIALPKISRALRGGSWLAAWWTVFRDADPESKTPFRHALEELLRQHALGRGGGGMPGALDHEAWREALATEFAEIRVEDIRWSISLDSRQLTGLFATFTEVTDLASNRREMLLDDIAALVDEQFGGNVVENYVTVLYLARKAM